MALTADGSLGRSANEKNYAKELNRLSLQQKDTEIGTFFLTLETLLYTKKAARRLAESQRLTAKLWNKGLATMRLIRSNETRNLTYCKYFDVLSFTSNKVRSLYNS